MNPTLISPTRSAATTNSAGQSATGPSSAPPARTPQTARDLWHRHHLFVWTLLGGVLIVAGWVTENLGSTWAGHSLFALGYLSGGWLAAKESFDGLREYRLDVNLLMTVAAIGAAILGRWAEGGMLIFLFSLSNTLEHYALEKTKNAVRALMDLRPAEARRIGTDGPEIVSVEALQVGDRVLVKAGEKIPADGQIVEGQTTIDRSTFTGESIPIESSPGDHVLAGTINLSGMITVHVARRAADTALAAIISRVEQAQSGRVPTNTFVAWFGQRYAIGVLVGATLAVVIPPMLMRIDWGSSFYRSLTLLVVASPCALIISTPAAVLSALGRAARRGVLFKGGSHLITLGKIKAIAFDKTGTLTEGKATVTDVMPVDGANESEILSLAAAVESGSTHPLAQAVVDAAHRQNLSIPSVKDSTTHPGLGVIGVAQDGPSGPPRRILVGSRRLFAGNQIDVPGRADEILKGFEEQGKTAVLVGTDRVLGVIAIADPPRRTAIAALRDLRRLGARSIGILTGDNQRVAQAMANQLGIDDVQAELLPEEKADAVSALLRMHGTVAVVGDGINDAPALATASVGIAMGGAKNDVVLETADVVLMSDDLSCLPYAVRLAQRTNRTIVENLTFALVVIALLLVGTFLGRIPLPVGVIGHEGSTLLVVLNSLRLLWYK